MSKCCVLRCRYIYKLNRPSVNPEIREGALLCLEGINREVSNKMFEVIVVIASC